MGGSQPAPMGAGETIAEFMQRRAREVVGRNMAEQAGRAAWAASTSTGNGLSAPRTADVVALGARAMDRRPAVPPRTVTATAQPSATFRSAGPSNRMSGAGATPQKPQSPQGSWYGNLYAPPPDDLAELRRQQAEFARTTREIDKQNSWLAIPALAPVAAVFGLEGAAAIAGRALTAEAIEGPLNFVDREAWQRGTQRAAQALSDAEKNALRSAARARLARANGISTKAMQAEVHHSDPLAWAHLKPNADPNRLANLWGLRGEAHDIATRAWADFSRSLKGRVPTQAELMEAKLRIDRMVEPFIRRAGVPRSNTPPREGGPI